MLEYPTKKVRISVPVPKEVEVAIQCLAKRDETSFSAKVLELIHRALELEEDAILLKIAELRDTPKAKFLSHNEVWG